MNSSNSQPKWWQLYLTFPLLMVLFAVDNRLRISSRGHQAVQIGIVLFIYGLIHFWLKANATALSKLDRRQDYGRVRVIRVPVSRLPDSRREMDPLFQRSGSEIKGVLSNTFEIDFIDAASLPVDETLQEVDKE